MKRSILLSVFFVMIAFIGFSQKALIEINGSVVDEETGKPVTYALIDAKKSNTQAISDENGQFTIEASIGEELVFSHVGFEKFTFKIKNGKEVNVELASMPIQIEDILVVGHRSNVSQSDVIVDEENLVSQPRNVADLFKNITGFNLSKRSSYSIDPIFRSFKYEQLNIQYDGGVKAMHACPNRMDPVTTHVMPEEIEKIEVIRGPFSVRFGPNFGGVVNLKTSSPSRIYGSGFHGAVESGYESNGNAFMGKASLGVVNKKFDLMLNGGMRDYGNYKGGDGLEVPSSFKSYDYSVKMGFKPKINQLLQVNWRQSFARDVLHAGLPMDNRTDDSSIASVDYKIKNISQKLYSISFKAFYANVDHVMDNFDRKNFKIVEAETPVNAETLGGKLEFSIVPSKKINIYAGLDMNYVGRTGYRNKLVKIKVMPDTMITLDTPKNLVDSVWQNSSVNDVGAFVEGHFHINSKSSLNAGFRLDFVNAQIKEPASDFAALYDDFEKVNEVNFSGFLSYHYQLSKRTNMELAFGRGMRTASATERFINHFSVGSDPYELVGNPHVKPEVNNQVELSLEHVREQFSAGGNVFYSHITDFITAAVDESIGRKFYPWQQPIYARRFQNIDVATQAGFELFALVRPFKGFSAKGAFSYTRAHNKDWDEPLPQIPPMQTLLTLKYERDLFWVDVRGRFVGTQDRFAKSFGETETPDFYTIDLRAAINPLAGLTVGFAVLNLADTAYYEHLNYKYKNQTDNNLTGQFYEPGRNVTAYVKYSF